MEKHIVDKKTGIPYTLIEDYYYPYGDLPDDEPEENPIGNYGRRHLEYIKKHKQVLYTELLTSEKLHSYLANLNEEAIEMQERLVKQMAVQQGITEQLKANNQMVWVGAMNNIHNRAMKIVMNDLIYN
jgi:hypothetical protein